MKTEYYGIGLVILSALFSSFGGLFMKFASGKLKFTIPALITNYWLIGGAVAMLVSLAIYVQSLNFGELSVLYPFVSLSYLFVIFHSRIFLKEKINIYKVIGVLLIIAGVTIIGLTNH